VISHLELTDVKAFHRLSMDFSGLTVLLGPNNSGKSSIIAPIRLLAQTMQSADPDLSLLLDGPMGDFGTFRDMVHGNHRGRPMRIGLTVAYPAGDTDSVRTAEVDIELKYRTQRRELVIREAVLKGNGKHIATTALSSDAQRHVLTRVNGTAVPAAQRSALSDYMRMRHFVPQIWPYALRRRTQTSLATEPLLAQIEQVEEASMEATFLIEQSLQSVEYLSALRQAPERTYHQTGAARTRVGPTGDNWAGLFVLDSSKPPKQRTIVPGLVQWLRRSGLASNVRLNWLSDRHYEVQIQHAQSREWQNLADVGQAHSQVIPVLVGGLRLPSGSTYLVEEPEIHLHPGAQADLGDFFVDLIGRGVSSIVETHSEYLVLRLQQHVASGDLRPDQVRFVYVDSTRSGKRTRVLSLDEQARFLSQLEGGFFPQRLEEARKLARIRGSRS
jgi:predicted ATPase